MDVSACGRSGAHRSDSTTEQSVLSSAYALPWSHLRWGHSESHVPPPPMRQLFLSSKRLSFFLSVQIALDAEGIRHTDEQWAKVGAGDPNRILVDDADFERAVAVVSRLRDTPTPAAAGGVDKVFWRVAIMATLAMLGAAILVRLLG